MQTNTERENPYYQMEKMQTLKGEYKNMHKGNIIMQRRENTIKPQNVKHKQQKQT